MKFIIALAFKNMWRYRRRTLITAFAIAIGVGMYIFMDAWLLGAEYESVRNLVRLETGSARIFHNLFWENYTYFLPRYNISRYEDLIAALKQAGYRAVPRLSVLAEIINTAGEGDSATIQLSGIDPDQDREVFALEEAITPQGAGFLQKGQPDIVLGKDLATRLGLKLGSTVELRTKTADGIWTGFQARLRALLDSPNPIINSIAGFVALDTLQECLSLEGRVTDIAIGFAENLDPEQETKKINTLLETLTGTVDYRAYSFNEIAFEFGMIAQTKSAGSKILLFLIFIIAAIGVSNTMLMEVFERVREIGMMRALGMKDSGILLSFFYEALGIGLLGALGGAVLGVVSNIYMVNIGIDLSPFIKGMGNIGYRSTGLLKSVWNPQTIVSAAVLSVLFAGLIALLPARRAIKKTITECLRVK